MSAAAFSPPTLNDASRWAGLRVGLLGGSFNPPHEGHLHIAKLAMAKFGLDFVWWVVSPQNPLKQADGMAPYEDRFALVEKAVAGRPRMMATHIERDLGTRYTFETVQALKAAYPGTEFLWICGMDNALIFHRWEKWQDIIAQIPVVFIARPPADKLVSGCPLRQYGGPELHRHGTQGRKTDLSRPGIYWLSGARMVDMSSTKIRNLLKTKP